MPKKTTKKTAVVSSPSRKLSTASKPVKPVQTAKTAESAVKPLPEAQGQSLADRLEAEFGDISSSTAIVSEAPLATGAAPHLIVIARAGTGKTTTLVEGLKIVKGIYSKLIPSPQQAAVWEQMKLSSKEAESICFVAFNKSIATELQTRMPAGCNAMTLHSMGNKACFQAYGKLRLNQYRTQDLLSDLTGLDTWEMRKKKGTMVSAVEDLVALCKQNLIGSPDMEQNEWEEALDVLCSYYEVELNGSKEEVYKYVPQILELCRNPLKDNCMDFNDMIWLPVINSLPCYRYKVLLVDEAQDLNRCQQQLALKSGDRLILCGDPCQAIYGFAGADAESMSRMEQILKGTPRGCETLPLTVTRRCGQLIVTEAQSIVPDFEAFETNPLGVVTRMEVNNYTKTVNDGDFILCRVNGPLVSQCFRFLKEGRKANIQGRDVGQGLISTIKKLSKGKDWDSITSVVDFLTALDGWYHGESKKELAKRNPSESRLITLEDRKSCLEMFCQDVKSLNEVISKIESIFTDTNRAGIRLSSIHKSKGLEAKRVFLLEPKGATVPHPMAKSDWQRGQEMNLRYVAITRAIEEIVYVTEQT
jgi:DNA helicase-2/ATP-dependent DNA helicase PcrA